jgi:murein DD-endopeptidase MepM/ murein hydrolase activator NlpD
MSIKISGVKPTELAELKKSFAKQHIPSGGPDNGYDSIEMSDKTNNAYKSLLIENSSLNQLLSAFPKDKPVRYAFTSSLYGIRIHPVTKNLNLHEGDDYVPTLDTNAYATMAGRVSEVGYDQGYGNYVIIDHGHNIKTRYAHLASAKVRLNQEIKKADIIGKIGSTGLSTGNHLHYEIMLNNNKINPSIIMALAKNV